MLSTINFPPRGAKVYVGGDSITARLETGGIPSPYQMLAWLFRACRQAAFNSALQETIEPGIGRNVDLQPTTFINFAQDGSSLSNMATQATGNFDSSFTHAILSGGINNYNQAGPVTQAALHALAAVFPAQIPVLLIGPYARGEKWPSGQNTGPGTNDAAIDSVDVDMGTIFPADHPQTCWVSLRQTIYQVTMPALNTPAPGVSAFFTVDGVHPTFNGNVQSRAVIEPKVTFIQP